MQLSIMQVLTLSSFDLTLHFHPSRLSIAQNLKAWRGSGNASSLRPVNNQKPDLVCLSAIFNPSECSECVTEGTHVECDDSQSRSWTTSKTFGAGKSRHHGGPLQLQPSSSLLVHSGSFGTGSGSSTLTVPTCCSSVPFASMAS